MDQLKLITYILLIISSLLLSSCSSSTKKVNRETPTQGNIKMAFDNSYRLLADAELYTFHSLYANAKITPIFASEDSILKLFLADTVNVIMTSRKITENEEAFLKSKMIIPRTTKIAYDAVAFIINKSNSDSLIRYNTIRDIFLGKVSSWAQINPTSKLDDIQVVFDDPGSNNVRLLMSKFEIKGSLPKYCSAASGNEEVVEYVERHPNSIGIISVNWISDPSDSISHSFLSKIKVVNLSAEYDSDGDDFYSPHPAYIADRSYPFIRDVYMINKETFSGLGTGFTSFVASDPGQRIVLRMGMVPAAMPVRLVEIKKN